MFLLNKHKIIQRKEYALEEYKVVKPADKFHSTYKLSYLLNYCEDYTLLSRITSKYGNSIPI